jgi:hypothetical protein
VFVVSGYELTALEAVAGSELTEAALIDAGAVPGAIAGLYALSHCATPADVAPAVRDRQRA